MKKSALVKVLAQILLDIPKSFESTFQIVFLSNKKQIHGHDYALMLRDSEQKIFKESDTRDLSAMIAPFTQRLKGKFTITLKMALPSSQNAATTGILM